MIRHRQLESEMGLLKITVPQYLQDDPAIMRKPFMQRRCSALALQIQEADFIRPLVKDTGTSAAVAACYHDYVVAATA